MNSYSIENILAHIKNKDPRYFVNLPEELKNDKNFILTAISHDGGALAYASDELKDDKEIVLVAVSNYASALRYASENLQNDYDIVLTAVTHNGLVLKYASEDLRNNKELIFIAMQTSTYCFSYASLQLKNDYDLLKIFISETKDPNIKKSNFYIECLTRFKILTETNWLNDKIPNNNVTIKPRKF